MQTLNEGEQTETKFEDRSISEAIRQDSKPADGEKEEDKEQAMDEMLLDKEQLQK